MQKRLIVKGMDSPRPIGIGVATGLLLIAALMILNRLLAPADSGHPRTAPVSVRLESIKDILEPAEPVEDLSLKGRPLSNERLNTVSVRLRSGERSASALARAGARPESANEALAVLARMVEMRSLKVGQQFIVALNDQGMVRSLRFPLGRLDYIEVAPDPDGSFAAEKKRLPVDVEIVEGACGIKGTLYESFKNCGMDRQLVPVIVDLLDSQVDLFTEIRKGDTIRLVARRESLNGEFVGYGRIEGLLIEGKMVTAGVFMRENADGTVSYFDSGGYSIERPFSRNPIKYNIKTAGSALRRLHPILHAYTPGRAVDYSAPRGTPVVAVGAGKVVFSGRRGSGGRTVVIGHDNGLQTYYARLDSIRTGLSEGDEVRAGSEIGTVGGDDRIPYLHFAVARDGRFVNAPVLAEQRGVRLGDTDLNDYLAYVGRMTGRLKSLPVRGLESVVP